MQKRAVVSHFIVQVLLGTAIAAARGGGFPLHARAFEPPAASMAVCGDSISVGFSTGGCFTSNPERAWAAGIDHGTDWCAAGPTGTFSHAERLECEKGAALPTFNEAVPGTGMVAGSPAFVAQATSARTALAGQPGPRYVAVFLGHNDANGSSNTKVNASCAPDRDPNDYCRISAAAYERELRKGLDQLIQLPGARIAVLSTLRLSQLCNFASMPKDAVRFWTASLGAHRRLRRA